MTEMQVEGRQDIEHFKEVVFALELLSGMKCFAYHGGRQDPGPYGFEVLVLQLPEGKEISVNEIKKFEERGWILSTITASHEGEYEEQKSNVVLQFTKGLFK